MMPKRQFFTTTNFSTYGLHSNSELLLVLPSTKTKKTLGDRAFTAAAPSLWNERLSAIGDEDNLKCFKSKLKKELLTIRNYSFGCKNCKNCK